MNRHFKIYSALLLHIIIVLILVISDSKSQTNPLKFLGWELPEEANMDVPELVIKQGYPVEEHTVSTEDGYLLKVHRIPHGKKRKTGNSRPPILLMHGLLGSSSDWILIGAKDAFGYMLADEGFDVWMGNARGNYYSRNHTTLDPDRNPFWNFTFHEIGFYDLPAMIDHILNETGRERLHYVGHSQGSTIFFVMTSLKDSYNDKVASMNAFAPAMYNATTMGSFTNIMNFVGYIHTSARDYDPHEVYPRKSYWKSVGNFICNSNAVMFYLCKSFIFSITGQGRNLNREFLPISFGHAPAGASNLQFTHYNQFYLTGEFKQFDYGKSGNIVKYNSPVPPFYRLKNVRSPVMIHYGETDYNINHALLDRLASELGNCMGKMKVDAEVFNHLDFVWGSDAWRLLYKPTIKLIKKMDADAYKKQNDVL